MSIVDRLRRLLGQHEQAPAAAPEPDDEGSLRETYITALGAQRAGKDHFFLHDPASPLPPAARADWTGLPYFPPDPVFQFALPLRRAEPETLAFGTSTGDEQTFERIGTVAFEVAGQAAQLAVYQGEEGDLFLPFRDATSGKETYGAGRYLEPIPLGDGQLLVDFNLAYNPYCAYSPDFTCPLPPAENWLRIPIYAGERYENG